MPAAGWPGCASGVAKRWRFSSNVEEGPQREGTGMTIDDVKTIGVVGAGQMGRGIAQVLATSGWNVLLVDVAEEVLEEATRKLWQGVTKAVEKGALRGDQAGAAMAIIHQRRAPRT